MSAPNLCDITEQAMKLVAREAAAAYQAALYEEPAATPAPAPAPAPEPKRPTLGEQWIKDWGRIPVGSGR